MKRFFLLNQTENSFYAGSVKKLLLKFFIWKKSDFNSVTPVYSINTETSRQVCLSKIVCPCKQNRGCRKESFCISQKTTFQDRAKKQQERGKSRSVKASTGNITIFVLLVVTQAIDFRRWDSKRIPKGGPSQKSAFLQLTQDTPPSLHRAKPQMPL